MSLIRLLALAGAQLIVLPPSIASCGLSFTKAVDAFKDLKDLASFQQSISLGTSLQHPANSWFVQLGNFVLL